MKTEFNLNEKRKQIDRLMVKMGLDLLNIKKIHNLIVEQDAEFIRLLKEYVKHNVFFPPQQGLKLYKEIDRLAGEKFQ